jgi:hypothetical protein
MGGMGGMSCAGGSFAGTISPAVNGGFKDAFDAAPDSNATTVYFTAIDAMGNPGVFTQGICPVGAVKQIASTTPFEAPFGIAISSDDKRLYIADAMPRRIPRTRPAPRTGRALQHAGRRRQGECSRRPCRPARARHRFTDDAPQSTNGLCLR